MQRHGLRRLVRYVRIASVGVVVLTAAAAAQAQPIGVEMQNTMLPVAGAMGGASIAQPQEILAAVNANPAAMARFGGTQFQFGGGFAEATFNLEQTSTLRVPGVTPFAGKSGAPGAAVANIGMSRQTSLLGFDTTFGFGLISNAGSAIDFRRVPASNLASSNLLVLEMTPSLGVKLTEKLCVGANMSVGNGFFDGPFVGNGAMVQDYATRFGLGMNYDVTDATTVGWYWQTRQKFNFQNAVSLELFNGAFDVSRNVRMDLPSTFGFGIANHALCDGRLLLAVDAVFKQWDDASLFSAVYDNQWALMFGSQYSLGKVRLRSGYTYAENPLKSITGASAGGIAPPGGIAAIQYLQAQFASFNQNRISAGVGIVDLTPGLDVDFFAGGMLPETTATGPFTTVKLQSYWVGLGLTYRFGTRGVPSKL
jgi:long-chain fatty acid transport protein